MKQICRFEDCKQYGQMNAIYVNTQNGNVFELTWCKKCGRVQNEIG